MYKYWIIFLLMAFVMLSSCAKSRGVKSWQQPSRVAYNELKEEFMKRSNGVNAIKGRLWAQVIVNGKERPSVKSDLYWLKAGDGEASFRVVGYGPFSVTLFDAYMERSYFQLVLPRDEAVFWTRPNKLERYIARFIFDPWGIATLKGVEYRVVQGGNLLVEAKIQGKAVIGLFDPTLNPIFIKIKGIEILFGLPEKITVNLKGKEAEIVLELRLGQVSEATKGEVLRVIEKQPDCSGLRWYPLKDLIESVR